MNSCSRYLNNLRSGPNPTHLYGAYAALLKTLCINNTFTPDGFQALMIGGGSRIAWDFRSEFSSKNRAYVTSFDLELE